MQKGAEKPEMMLVTEDGFIIDGTGTITGVADVCPLLFSEGGGDMQSTFQQILLLGGAVGSIVGGVFAVLSYLKSYKKKK